jgi:zinc transporter ZupT
LKLALLFFAPLVSGLSVFWLKNRVNWIFRFSLVFTGAFFLGITVLHILPEAFLGKSHFQTGLFILIGYSLQVIIEYFTSGIEHGHLHQKENSRLSVYGILVALCVHSLLEGTILSHDYAAHADHAGDSVFSGLLLHKITAAFALITVISQRLDNKSKVVICLLIFSSASPLGLFLAEAMHDRVNQEVLHAIYALVAGNFLQISTTIFFESTPGHEIKAKNLIAGGLGMGLAILIELIAS